MRATRRQLLAGAAAAGAGMFIGDPRFSRPRADGPNILLVVIDSLRADHALGPLAHTPAIDALVRAGTAFPNAFPEAMPTVPARNSILSGRRGFPFRGWHDYRGLIAKPGWSPPDRLDDTFTRVLWRAGWWTAYVTDNPFLGFSQPYKPFRRSFDVFIRRGGEIGGRDGPVDAGTLDHWLHPAVRAAGMSERVRRYIANADYSNDESESFAARVFGAAADLLPRAARRQPFLLVADSFEPHEPWTPPRRYVDLYGDTDYAGPEPAMPFYGRAESWLGDEERPAVLERMRALYAAEVTMTDHWLGMLLERLHDLGLAENTVVALISDHGILIGERGWTGKISSELHPELINVPFVLVDPSGQAALPQRFFASTHDVAPTLLSLAGVSPSRELDGVDLSPALHGGTLPDRPNAWGGYSNNHFLRDDTVAYMGDNRAERAQLFELPSDPGELTDLAAARADVVNDLYGAVRRYAGGSLPWYDA